MLKAACDCTEDELRAHCLRELGRYKTPKAFRFVAELAEGAVGQGAATEARGDSSLISSLATCGYHFRSCPGSFPRSPDKEEA